MSDLWVLGSWHGFFAPRMLNYTESQPRHGPSDTEELATVSDSLSSRADCGGPSCFRNCGLTVRPAADLRSWPCLVCREACICERDV